MLGKVDKLLVVLRKQIFFRRDTLRNNKHHSVQVFFEAVVNARVTTDGRFLRFTFSEPLVQQRLVYMNVPSGVVEP